MTRLHAFRRRTAQVVSLDVLFSFIVFAFVLFIALWIWNYSTIKTQAIGDEIDLSLVADRSSAVFFMTSGQPSYWDQYGITEFSVYNISSLGMLGSYYVDEEKIEHLRDMNATYYDVIKQLLGVQGPGYEVYIEYYPYNSGSGTYSTSANTTIGQSPSGAAYVVVRNYYGVNIDNEIVKVSMKIWK